MTPSSHRSGKAERAPRRRGCIAGTVAIWALGVSVLACGAPATDPPRPRVEPTLSGSFERDDGAMPGADPGAPTTLGDCDGDGWLDVLHSPSVWSATPSGPFLERRLSADVVSATAHDPSVLGDVDRDGAVDLLVAGNDLAIARGLGGCAFDRPRIAVPRVCGEGGRASAITASDADLDGALDVLVSCHNGEAFVVALGRGDGGFEPVLVPSGALVRPVVRSLPTFNALLDDLDGDGVLDGLFLSDTDTSWVAWGASGDRPTFVRDDALTRALAPRSPMSVVTLDFDGDGSADRFFAGNGAGNVLWAHGGARDLVDVAGPAGVAGDGSSQRWTALAEDFDRDGWPDLLVLRLGVPDREGVEAALPPDVFLNRHDGTFASVGDRVAPLTTHGYAASCGDLFGDGLVSCIVDELPGLTVLRNRTRPPGEFVGLRLIGTVSAAPAFGARVTARFEEREVVLFAGASVGTYRSHSLELRIATPGEVPVVTVRWPSGLESEIEGLVPNAYVDAVEPAVLRVPRRVVPADGSTTVEIVAVPALIGAASATIERSGAGEWVGPAEIQGDGTIRRVLRAPSAAGECRIELLLDGEPLRVQPRIRFE